MDNQLGDNDPYRNMRTAQDEMRPEFLGKKDGKNGSSAVAAESLKNAESEAGGSFYNNGKSSMQEGEENPTGFYNSGAQIQLKNKIKTKKFGKFTVAKAGAAISIVFVIALIGVAVVILGTPLFQIGNIDFNLMDALGFTPTVGILEKQAEYVVKDEMAHGKMPDELAGKLAAHGLTVGQVAANGDFVRTNVYIANVDELKDLAVLGNFQVQPSTGELAMLYDGEVITADKFVAAVESNPVMYADYSAALEIGALYYYGRDADGALSSAGVSRSVFGNWVDTGDEEKNKESYREMLEKGINKSFSLTVGGYAGIGGGDGSDDSDGGDSGGGGSFMESISGGSDASGIVNSVAEKTKDYSSDVATMKGAQLLNTVISASEPYLAAADFMAVEESLQRARIEGTGPVHETMDLLYEENEIEYGGDEVKSSIITTDNFVAAVSSGKYSKAEAEKFSRDRGLLLTGMSDSGIIRDTAMATSGQSKSEMVLGIGNQVAASQDALRVLDDSIDIALIKSNSDSLASFVGGNRIVEGGAFVNKLINTKAVGAMGSDAATVAAYHREEKEVIARKAEAERATKSPFDISSPYTFMGSVARKIANVSMQGKSGSAGGTVVGAIASLAADSARGIYNTAVADGDDDSYTMTYGDYCETVNSAADVAGDIYCTEKSTISLENMEWGKDEWGDIASETGYEEFVLAGMERQATVGVKSADVCERYKDKFNNWLDDLSDKIAGFFGLYTACMRIEDVGTGEKYAFSSSNSNSDSVKRYGAYARYDQVASLLEGRTTAAAKIREEYYAKHPQDNSVSGRLARITGLSKDEAEVALAYADYLTMIARYNPATRYAFDGAKIQRVEPTELLVEHANRVAVDLYVMWHGRTEYDDLRSRVQVV